MKWEWEAFRHIIVLVSVSKAHILSHIKDVVTYYLNLTHANAATGRWEKEYRLTESFRVQDASPASMHQVLELMANNHCYLQKYYDFNSVSYDLKDCGSDCRVDHVCAAREVDFDRYERCLLKEGAVFIYGGLLPLLSVALSLMVASEWWYSPSVIMHLF